MTWLFFGILIVFIVTQGILCYQNPAVWFVSVLSLTFMFLISKDVDKELKKKGW